MDTEIDMDGRRYRLIGNNWIDTETFTSVPRVLARRLDARLRAMTGSAAPKAKPKSKTLETGDEGSTFHHADTFPIIAAIIEEHSRQTDAYLTHREIVDAFLAHPEGRGQATAAAQQQDKSIERVASNIGAWFSKRFTEGDTPYQDRFERQRIDGRWAYRRL